MTPSPSAREVADSLMEQLASIEHERWSGWIDHAEKTRSPARVANWIKLSKTPYSDLSEELKELDREEVRKYVHLITAALETYAKQKVEEAVMTMSHNKGIEIAKSSQREIDAGIAEKMWGLDCKDLRNCETCSRLRDTGIAIAARIREGNKLYDYP